MYPQDLKYSKEHEWVKAQGKTAVIGITHHAQDQLGDIVYVELPQAGQPLSAREEFGVAESVKTVSSLYSPVGGKIIEINQELSARPELINQDPYGKGWIIKVEMSDPADLNKLLSAEDYQKLLK